MDAQPSSKIFLIAALDALQDAQKFNKFDCLGLLDAQLDVLLVRRQGKLHPIAA